MRSFSLLLFLPLLVVAVSQLPSPAVNTDGTRLRVTSTENVGLAYRKQPSGTGALVAVSHLASATRQNGNGSWIVVGPAAMIRSSAVVTHAWSWHVYR